MKIEGACHPVISEYPFKYVHLHFWNMVFFYFNFIQAIQFCTHNGRGFGSCAGTLVKVTVLVMRNDCTHCTGTLLLLLVLLSSLVSFPGIVVLYTRQLDPDAPAHCS